MARCDNPSRLPPEGSGDDRVENTDNMLYGRSTFNISDKHSLNDYD